MKDKLWLDKLCLKIWDKFGRILVIVFLYFYRLGNEDVGEGDGDDDGKIVLEGLTTILNVNCKNAINGMATSSTRHGHPPSTHATTIPKRSTPPIIIKMATITTNE